MAHVKNVRHIIELKEMENNVDQINVTKGKNYKKMELVRIV